MSNTDILHAAAAHYYRDVLGLADWEERTARRLSREFDAWALAKIERTIGPVSGKRVLDLGCGWGLMLCELATRNPDRSIGIEPDIERARIARSNVDGERMIVVMGVGEELPLRTNFFDIVVCHEVLEHTADPEKVILEIVRVLKPGGKAHILVPNYTSFYEPHYKIAWLPLMPKALGRIYLRIRGRNPQYINHIQYVNAIYLACLLAKHDIKYKNLGLQNTIERVERIMKQAIHLSGVSFLTRLLAQAYTIIIHRELNLLIIKQE